MSALQRLRRSLFWPVLRKEFIQMRRDRLTLAMILVIPVLQLVLFGYAIRTEVRHLPTVVLDESRSASSRALVQVMEQTQNFDIVGTVGSREELRERIESGRARAAIVVPPSFDTDLRRRGRTAQAQVIVDAADPMASAAAISGAALAATVHAAALTGADRRDPPLEVRVRPWYNPALRSAVYIVPGIVGVLLTLTMLLITSMAIVRERERGTLEQLIVTPVGKTSLVLGKIVPFILVGYAQMTNVLLLGKLLFDVPVRGSVVLLYAITFLFIVAMLALGLLVSTLASNQAQAMQIGFFLLLPNILLSGFMFPREAMPAPAQWLGAALPLTYYLTVLRGILLKGVGFEYLWRETLILAGVSVLLIGLSVRRFAKTID
ncbi:MAG TPA: ABC transporter permease [Gemmatimonadaceae bacterium]|nr:ABC transporter permease [Gemmatimonadaceae bacterium]